MPIKVTTTTVLDVVVKEFPASPQGLIDAAKALITLREQAKNLDPDADTKVELVRGQVCTRLQQEDLDYVLYPPTPKKEKSALKVRLPSERTVQRGSGPLNRAAEVLGQG
jgi:hypothetical protein